MATPEKVLRPSSDRQLVKRYARRTDRPVTAQARADRWHQSKAVRAKVKDLVPKRDIHPAALPPVAATRRRAEELRANVGSRR